MPVGYCLAWTLNAVLLATMTSEQAVSSFKESAPRLFEEWKVARGPLGVAPSPGRIGKPSRNSNPRDCDQKKEWQFLDFPSCEDLTPPRLMSVDVRRGESLVTTTYLGLLHVEVHERCTIRRLIPPRLPRRDDEWEMLQRACLGKSYETCLRAGGRVPATKSMVRDCTGGPQTDDSYTGFLTLEYEFNGDAWRFVSSRKDPGREH